MSEKPKLEVAGIKNEPPSPEEMKVLLLADREARAKRALERIRQVLKEERCEMNPFMTITVQGVIPRIDITAVD